jgi:hypothetical protein
VGEEGAMPSGFESVGGEGAMPSGFESVSGEGVMPDIVPPQKTTVLLVAPLFEIGVKMRPLKKRELWRVLVKLVTFFRASTS